MVSEEPEGLTAPTGDGGTSRPTGKRSTRATRPPVSGAGSAVTKATVKGSKGASKAVTAKPPNVFKRLRKYLREVLAELRKVIWPSKKQMVTYTAVVLVFVVFMVAYIGGLDVLFIKGVTWLFG